MTKPIVRCFMATIALVAGVAPALLFLGSQSASAQEFKHGDLIVIHPWSRATPGGAKVAAGYAVIKNEGAEPDRLVSATVEVAGSAMLHEMLTANGVASMRMLPDGVVIPAHGEIALKPGGYHLMLEQLKRPLKEGDTFKGGFTFEKAGAIDVTFSVEPMGAKAPAADKKMDHMDDAKGMDHMKGM